MLILLEGILMCFILLLVCVIGIANGPVSMVTLYEKDVQQRVVELGLTTKEKIKKATILSGIALFAPTLILVPLLVYGINSAASFREGFWQMTAIYLIMNLFDRIFIDWYWVGKTKVWFIPGTEDLMPYIPKKVLIRKWVGSLVGFPMIAAMIAGVMMLLH